LVLLRAQVQLSGQYFARREKATNEVAKVGQSPIVFVGDWSSLVLTTFADCVKQCVVIDVRE
jgi:hypothetical protein